MKVNAKRYFPPFKLVLTFILFAVLFFALFLLYLLGKRIYVFAIVFSLIKLCAALFVISSELTPEAKCSWIFMTLTFAAFAIPTYMLFCGSRVGKKQLKILEYSKIQAPKTEPFFSNISAKCNENFSFLAKSAALTSSHFYKNTSATYLKSAVDMRDLLISDIDRAKSFVFLEYYTVADGKLWRALEDSLKRAVKRGCEARLIYDELGSLMRLPQSFKKELSRHGIRAVSRASVSGAFPSGINNRNHRKMAIIDGEIGYIGGINIADEYIDPGKRMGIWRDSAIRLHGEAVCELTHLFLSDFSLISTKKEDFSKYFKYRRRLSEGSCLVFGDGPKPIYRKDAAKGIILSMLSHAEKSFTATTPYLICGSEILRAIESCVHRGVKVRIVIPKKSDGYVSGLLTSLYAQRLAGAGAEIYEFSPGFLHAKSYICDEKYFMCGSVNLDFRSLGQNFEDAVLFASHPIIKTALEDLSEILMESVRIKSKRRFVISRLFVGILELFAPLF